MAKKTPVKRATVVALLVEMGYKAAATHNNARLLGKLAALDPSKDDLDKIDDANAKKLLKAILKDATIVNDLEIEGDEDDEEEKPAKGKKSKPAKGKGKSKAKADGDDEDEEEEEDEEESDDDDEEESDDDDSEEDEEESDDDEDEEEEKPAKKGKKGKGKSSKDAKSSKSKSAKKAKGKSKPARDKVERDWVGNAEGSQAATINAALSDKKPNKVAKIAEKIDLPATRVRSHMAYLIGKGFLKSTDEGYVLTKEGLKAKAKG
jgi:hypothetical protein